MKKFAAGAFGVTLLCFLLPFFHISCAGTRLLTVSGLTLVAGGKAQMGSDLKKLASLGERAPGAQAKGDEDAPKVDPEALAILAALAVVTGLVLCLVKGKAGATGGIATAICAVVLLFALMLKIDSDVKRDAKKQSARAGPAAARGQPVPPGLEDAMDRKFGEIIKVEAASGFILAVALLVVAGALSGVALYNLKHRPARDAPSG